MNMQNGVEDKGNKVNKTVEAFYKGTQEICNFAETKVNVLLRGKLNLNKREDAIIATYYQMHKWLETLVKLNQPWCFQASATAARSLFELLLDIKLLQSDTDETLLNKFYTFIDVEKYRVAWKTVTFCRDHPTIELCSSNAFLKQRDFFENNRLAIESLVIKHWGVDHKGKPKKPKHWSGINSISERAKVLGPYYEELYYEYYSHLSWYIHGGPVGYFGMSPESLEKLIGYAHSISQKIFPEGMEICAKETKVNLSIPNFDGIINNLRNASEKYLLEIQRSAE